jgi:hypothetical protein
MKRIIVFLSLLCTSFTVFSKEEKESAVFETKRKPAEAEIADVELAPGTKLVVQNNDFVFVYEKSQSRQLVAFNKGKKLGTYSDPSREMAGGCYIRLRSDSIKDFTIVNVLPGSTLTVLNESTIYSDSAAVGLALDKSTSITINGKPADSKMKFEFAMVCLGGGAGYAVKVTPSIVKSVFDNSLVVTPASYNVISIEPN